MLFELPNEYEFEGKKSRFVVRSYGLESILGEGNALGVFLSDENGKCLDWGNICEEYPWPDWMIEVIYA